MTTTITITDTETTIITDKEQAVLLLYKNPNAATAIDGETYTLVYENDTIKTIEDIIRIGSNSKYASDNLQSSSKKFTRWGDVKEKCFNPYEDKRRIAFREAI